ncbi:hypothetical protein NQZ68_016221 [Dissostichus eleginoides]|nr:hypothetical protein NQZ68_016221 [Dissostichus eleginoides]
MGPDSTLKGDNLPKQQRSWDSGPNESPMICVYKRSALLGLDMERLPAYLSPGLDGLLCEELRAELSEDLEMVNKPGWTTSNPR